MKENNIKNFTQLVFVLLVLFLFQFASKAYAEYSSVVVDKAVTLVQQKISHGARNVKIEIENIKYIDSISLKVCKTDVVFKDLFPHSRYGRAGIRASCLSPDWNLYIPMRVEASVPVVKAKRTIFKGQEIRVEDIEVKYIPHRSLRRGMSSSVDSLLGREVKRSVEKGSYIYLKNTSVPFTIKKDDVVTIIFESGNIKLETKGVSAENGRVGDIVKVYNKSSKKATWGKVMKDRKILVN
jgi:flagella basal body P-ring formation protein FlgA